MKTLKKAAVIGAVAYGGYQLGKLSGGYSHWGWGRSHGYGFNDYNRWREIDGFMCRNNNDCNWIDDRLYCQDYELDFRPSVSTIDNSLHDHVNKMRQNVSKADICVLYLCNFFLKNHVCAYITTTYIVLCKSKIS